MYLFICAQDIEWVTYALVKDDLVVFQKTVESSPELYLFFLDQFLSEHKMSSSDLRGIFIVNGPGSFTASRISVTIANTLAFAHGIPIMAMENIERLSVEGLLVRKRSFSELPFVFPVYNKPPTITR